MKLEINGNSLQHSFDNHFLNRNGFEMTDEEIGNMLRMGVKLAQEGNRSDARHLLLRVTDVDPENETAWLWLASISEYPEELLIFLQNVLKINPENERAIEWSAATKSLLAKTFVQRGIDASHDAQIDFAKQCFLQAIYYDAENEMAWLWRASITEDVEEKILHLQKVLSFNPENETAISSLKALRKESPQSLLRKANSAAVSGDRETAALMLEEIMADAPEFEEAWILKAYLANDFYEKLGCYEKVLELNPNNDAAQAGMTSLRNLMEKVESKPETSYQEIEPAIESPSENSEKSLQIEEHLEAENVQEVPTEFAHESFETEVSDVELIEFDAVEELIEDSSTMSGGEVETANQLSENDNAENFSMRDDQVPDLEIGAYEEKDSAEDVEDQAEELFFHADSPTQELEDIKPESVDFHQPEESEIELVENRNEEVTEFSPTAESEFSLNTEEDPEMYLIDDTQTPNSYDFNFNETVQKEHSFSIQPEENSIEVKEQSVEEQQTSEEAYELKDSFETNYTEAVSTNDYFGNYDQPTVEFSYNDEMNSVIDEPAVESAFETVENQTNEVNESPEERFDSAENFAVANSEAEHVPDETQIQQENVSCPFCGFGNEAQAISCGSCRAIHSLSDLEMLLAHQDADRAVLAQTIETMETEKQMRDFNEEELRLLGIAHLNAKNLRRGLTSLQEASKLNPNDVVLSSKVNFLAIRLSEIEAQENRNQENLSISRMIMVVDDSPTVRKLISGKLEKSGHTVITANDGIEALSKMNETIPDLVLLDIAMPQMDGYQVCKLIRSNELTKDVPIVMISGKDGFFDKVRGKMAGSTGYITKPFGPETLMKTLETYIA